MTTPAERLLACLWSFGLVVMLACWGSGRDAEGSGGAAAARLIFLDVGQGDATVVISPEGRAALIDAGPRGRDIVHRLRRHGIDTVDVAIATHPHADHIGGFAEVFAGVPLRYYMDNGVPHTTQTYRELLKTVHGSDVTYLEATARTLSLGSVSLRVLPPLPEAGNLNSGSIGVVVEYRGFRALLTGDSEVEELNHFLQVGVPDVDVLKAPHHGSRDAVSGAWLAATRPEVVVISCGRGNPYGHPHPWALHYYDNWASRVYRTDLDGEVTVMVRGDGGYAVIAERARTFVR